MEYCKEDHPDLEEIIKNLDNRYTMINNTKEMMQELGDLFVRFAKLEKQHPDELPDFHDGIHKCQYVLGMRIARYYEPELLPKK